MVSCHNFRPTQPSPACAPRRFLRHQAHCPITRRRPCAPWTCPCAATGLLCSDISWSANFETLSSVSSPWRSPRRYTHIITAPINVQALGRPFKLHALADLGIFAWFARFSRGSPSLHATGKCTHAIGTATGTGRLAAHLPEETSGQNCDEPSDVRYFLSQWR